MSDKLSWTFSLIDKVSGPAKAVSKAIQSVAKEAKAAGDTSKKSTPGIVRFLDSFKSPAVKNALTGVYNWIGKTYGPKTAGFIAKSATKLYQYNDVLKDLGINVADVGKGAASFLGKAGAGAVLGVAGLTAAGVALAGGAAFLGGKLVYSGMELITSAAMFKESTITGLELVMKSGAAANRLFDKAIDFAAATPFSAETVAGAFQKLATAGFKEIEIPIVMKAIGDMAAVKGFSTEVQERLILALGQIKSKGKLQGQEMMQLTEVGVNAGDVYDRLGKKLGKTRAEVIKLQAAGKISANMGIAAVVESVKETISGGKLGNAMDKFSKTMAGRLEQLTSAPMNLALKMDASPLAGAGDVVGKLAESMSPKGKLGSAIIGAGNMLIKAFEIKDPKAAFAMIEGALLGVVNVVKQLIPGVKSFVTSFASAVAPGLQMIGVTAGGTKGATSFAAALKVLGVVAGTVVSGVLFMASAFLRVWSVINGFVSTVMGAVAAVMATASSWYSAGTSMIQGFVSGILSGASSVINAARSVGNSAVAAVKSTLGIASPSKVFAELGMHTSEGFAMGVSGGPAQSATSQMVHAQSTVAPTTQGKGNQISVVINVAGGGESVADDIEEKLVAFFQGLVLQGA